MSGDLFGGTPAASPVEDAKARLLAAGFDLKRDHRLILDCLTPDFHWDWNDPENGGALHDLCCDLPSFEVMEVQPGYGGSHIWVARLEREDGGDDLAEFASEAEAEAACTASRHASAAREAGA